MLLFLTILLSLANLLPFALSVPSPRGGRGGGGHGGGSGGGGGGSSTGVGLSYLGGAIAASADNGYSTDGDNPPDDGDHASSTCTYSGGNATAAYATDPAWNSSMIGCLNALNADNWSGTSCAPPTGGVTFGFYKGEDDYQDPIDCFKRCSGCLSSAINAGQAVTTKCQYEYRTERTTVGYKTHTCAVGYCYNSDCNK